jgi:hypothetical protein
MINVDTDLQNGYPGYKVNLYPNGLMYINSSYSNITQYSITQYINTCLFYNSFSSLPGPYSVNGISYVVENYNTAAEVIWNHIKNNNQPVVVITDMNKLDYYNQSNPYPTYNQARNLHYQVVYGIYEQNNNQYFRVHDPWYGYRNNKVFSKNQYQNIIGMERGSPAWIYNYGTYDLSKTYPAYIMLVYGN